VNTYNEYYINTAPVDFNQQFKIV